MPLSPFRRRTRLRISSRVLPCALLPATDQEVRAKEGALEPCRLLHAQLVDDVPGHSPRGGGRQSKDRNIQPLLQALEAPVGRPKIVAPLADAMGLVHHQTG